MIDYQKLAYPMVGPMDTKVADPHLPRPSLALAQDCWANQTGELRKRYAFAQADFGIEFDGTAVPTFQALASWRDTYLGFSDRYCWVAANGRYIPVGGGCSTQVRVENVTGTVGLGTVSSDHARLSNYLVHASTEAAGATGQLRWVVSDETSGAILGSGTITGAAMPRVVVNGTRILVLFDTIAGGEIRVKIFNCSSPALLYASFAAADVQVANDYYTPGGFGSFFDAVENTTYGTFLAYRSSTANTLKFGFVSATGTLGSTSTIATTVDANAISCAVASVDSQTHGIVYVRRTTPSDVYAAIRTWNGTSWASTATSGAIDTSMDTVCSVTTCAFESGSTTLTLFYSGDAPATTSTDVDDRTHKATYTAAGTATARITTVYKAILASKCFRYQTAWYAAVIVGKQDLSGPTIAVVSLDGSTSNRDPVAGTPIAILSENGFNTGAFIGAVASVNYHGQVTQYGDTQFRFSFLQRRMATITGASPAQLPCAATATMDFQPYENHRTVSVGECLYIAGGVLLQYDGKSLVEAGFLRYVEPSTVGVAKSTSGALTASSDYAYMIVPEWTNASGVREQGTNAGPKVVTLGVGEDEVTLYIPTLALTMKSDVYFAIYRSLSNGSGAYYRIGTVRNDPTVGEVTYNDRAADTSIDEGELFPYADGALLDNAPTPAGSIICEVGGRVYVASPSVRGKITASKLREPDEALAFNDALVIQIPDDGVDITGMAPLGGALVVFTENAVYRVAGEGPANVTANGAPVGQWLTPEVLSVDTGCESQRSVVATPPGIMFLGKKGMMLLDQSFQLQYVGAPIEQMPAGFDQPGLAPMSGLLIPHRQQVRFLSTTNMFVYDYFHRLWTVWTYGGTGVGCVVADQHFQPFNGSGAVAETEGTYQDVIGNYEMLVRLAWVRDPASLMGETRVRRIGVVGRLVADATLTVEITRDFGSTVIETLTKDLVGTDVPFFAKWRPDTRINSATQLTIRDGGASAGGFRLHEAAFEIGIRAAGKSMGRLGD